MMMWGAIPFCSNSAIASACPFDCCSATAHSINTARSSSDRRSGTPNSFIAFGFLGLRNWQALAIIDHRSADQIRITIRVNIDGYSNWIPVGSNSDLNAGEGFTMKGTSGTNSTSVNGVLNNPGNKQRYDFRGKPNDGTISIPVGIGQFTLTGNPYPSAIDLSAF